jgi:hypothetical protein
MFERAALETGDAKAWLQASEVARRAGLYLHARRALKRARQAGASDEEQSKLDREIELGQRGQLLKQLQEPAGRP